METALRDVVVAARKWAKARARCLRIADSRSATPAEVLKAKRALSKASETLSRSVESLESFLQRNPNKSKKILDWGKVMGAASVLAGALEDSIRPKPDNPRGVIDTTGEEVPSSFR